MVTGRVRTVHLDTAVCRAVRRRLGLTREQLEAKAGLSVATLKRIEQGKVVYLHTASVLAEALGVPLSDLLHPSEDASRIGGSDRAARPLASIAVLPFSVIGPDDSNHVADGLVEDLIHRLSRSLFPVIAASSTFGRRDQPGAEEVLSQALRADYLVLGSVQRAGASIRVCARVMRATTNQVLCSHKYDRAYRDVFAAQDELAASIVEHARRMVLESEAATARQKRPADLSGWELAVLGSWHFHARSRSGNERARELFERAVQKDRDLPIAWYSLAMTHQRDLLNQWSTNPTQSVERMHAICHDFARVHPHDPLLGVASAYLAIYSGDRDTAAEHLTKALAVDPNIPAAYSLYGQILAMANDPDRAIEQFEVALRLSPLDAEVWTVHTAMALAHFVAHRYDETERWARHAIAHQPALPFPLGTLASALGHMGRIDEARTAVKHMLALTPDATVAGMATLLAATNRDLVERYQAGLRLAGLSSS